ncbi:protein YgfX [Stutzerimonas azotifigens]|uniref:Toxin CptA n=1 Tax=Stutzerimonas azotifigens TaxID=291995 RepID=A0ABR5YW70_9GAMM|nr:protein YgfX [Stutzerimonas azotifigens]MBA1272162.1 hypothetical protein [Stutzerimonas azotifigens]
MSNPSDPFVCQWKPSTRLLALYLLGQSLALLTLLVVSAPLGVKLLGLAGCIAHAGWTLPRQILLSHRKAWRALRHDAGGWQLWNERAGWQRVQLRRDSLALPLAIVLRFRVEGQRFACSVCIPRDALPRDQHRRLRLRLKFSRRRWAAPE